MTEVVTLPPERHTAPVVNGDALDEIVYGQRVELPPMGIFETWIATLLDRCLEFDPSARPSARELASALERHASRA